MFYFIISTSGVEAGSGDPYISNEVKQVSANNEAASDDKNEVKIVNPMELYADYDLNNDDAAWDLLVDSDEITEEDFDVLASLAQQEGWPSGLNTYSARETNRAKMKDYKAYMALDYEKKDKTHLIMIYILRKKIALCPKICSP